MITSKTPVWLMTADDGGDSGGTGEAQEAPPEYKAPATQAELDRLVQGRVARAEKAVREQFTDYAELKKFRDSHETDLGKAVETAKGEARAEVEKVYGRRLAEVEVRAAASAMRFHDPADAVRLVEDLDSLVKGGAVDAKAIGEQLRKVADAKPYLLDGAAVKSLRRPGVKREGEDVTDPSKTKPGEKRSVQLLRGYGRR